jgi:C1A family cysteine protease
MKSLGINSFSIKMLKIIKNKRISYYFNLTLLIVYLLINSCKCDLPVHCLAGNMEGVWLIHMTNNNGDNKLKCGHDHPDKNLDHISAIPEKGENFNEKYQTLVKLERPNMIYSMNPKYLNNKIEDNSDKSANSMSSFIDAYNTSSLKNDDNDNDKMNFSAKNQIGTWTMIYDEGFELNFGNNVFFAFSRYEQVIKFTPQNTDTEDTPGYKSVCNKTFIGWFRNKNNSNWGCFWAEKVTNFKKYNLEEINYQNIFSIKNLKTKSNKSHKIVGKTHHSIIIKKEKDEEKEQEQEQDDMSNDLNKLAKQHKENNSQNKKSKKFLNENKENNDSDENTDSSSKGGTSIPNYVDFLKSLIKNTNEGEQDGMSSVPHLDIYFMNSAKEDTEYQESNFLEAEISSVLKEKTFSPDMEYVKKINNPKNNFKWEATIYPAFVGKSYSSMRSLLGNVNSMKNLINTKVEEPTKWQGNQFIELDVSMSEKSNKTEMPASFTWQSVDGLCYDSPIKKQGECGSCYALAMLSVFESRLRIKSNNRSKPILSSSSIIGCSRLNQGCSGGYPYLVGKHAVEFGFVEESCQPYEEDDKTCKTMCYEEKVYKAKTYGYVGDYYGGCNDEKMMDEIYNNGPIVVALNATPELYYYKSGIFHSDIIKKEGKYEKGIKPWEYTNHAVVAIGWGEEYVKETLEKFWILKNSWGEEWGEKGYFRMTRGVNMASIEAQGVFVTPQ